MGEHLKEAGIETSMGSKGSALDNAVVESFFSTLKRELVNRYSWPTKADARVPLFEWIEAFYNRTRLHTTLGNYPPRSLRTSPSPRQRKRLESQAAMCPPKRDRATPTASIRLTSTIRT